MGRAPQSPVLQLLLVEDEPRSQQLVRFYLEARGCRVHVVATGNQALTMLAALDTPGLDLVLMKLPDMDGYALLQAIRQRVAVPILVLSAYGHTSAIVRALEYGADDYLTKPFDPDELHARISAVLRRGSGQAVPPAPSFALGPLQINYQTRQVWLHGTELTVTPTEYRLLEVLAQNAGRTLVMDVLVTRVWGPEYLGEYQSLHLYISRLRRKLGESSRQPRLILTRAGVGYMMPATVDPEPSLRKRVA